VTTGGAPSQDLIGRRIVYQFEITSATTREVVSVSWVSKNGLFEPFMYKNEHFTKTGSGQT
jgi:hypothetical protein